MPSTENIESTINTINTINTIDEDIVDIIRDSPDQVEPPPKETDTCSCCGERGTQETGFDDQDGHCDDDCTHEKCHMYCERCCDEYVDAVLTRAVLAMLHPHMQRVNGELELVSYITVLRDAIDEVKMPDAEVSYYYSRYVIMNRLQEYEDKYRQITINNIAQLLMDF